MFTNDHIYFLRMFQNHAEPDDNDDMESCVSVESNTGNKEILYIMFKLIRKFLI